MQHGAFAFPDAAGTRLLANPDLAGSAAFHTALCTGGRRMAVRFERRQAESKGHNGRQNSNNFDKLAGNVFAVLQGRIEDGATCFIAGDTLLSSATLLPAAPAAGSSECDAALRGRLAAGRGRQVVHCWPMAALPEDKRLVLAEFARQGNNALASVILIDGDRMIFADYTAEFRGEGQDLWRVDDGGVLSPEGFRIVFVLQRGTSYTLGVDWPGAEGSSLAVFESDGGERFTRVIADYWYRAPI